MRSSFYFWLAAKALLFAAIYVGFIVWASAQGWFAHAPGALTQGLLVMGFGEEEAANLSGEIGGALLQSLTFGALVFGLAYIWRAVDGHGKRKLVSKQVLADYIRILNTLERIRTGFKKAPQRNHEYLRHLIAELQRNLNRLQARSTEFAGVIGTGAFQHFENVSNAMDNLHGFASKVKNWNDGIDRDRSDPFWVDVVMPTEILGHDRRVDTFIFIHNELMSFFQALGIRPSTKAHRRLEEAANDFQAAREKFLEVRTSPPSAS